MAKTPATLEREALETFMGEVNAQRWRYGYRSYRSLGDALGIAMSTANEYCNNPDGIRLGTLRKMVRLLKLDPMVVLAALGYTSRDIRNFIKEYGQREAS